MKLGFRRKLFLSSMLLIFLVALPSGFYLQSALQQWSQEQISAELERQVETVRVLVEETSRLSSDRRAFSTTVHRVATASTSDFCFPPTNRVSTSWIMHEMSPNRNGT